MAEISQAVKDHVAAYRAAGGKNLGTIGDARHQRGCGDHTAKDCSGHPGWYTANDSESGGSYNAGEFGEWLASQLRAGRYRGQIKFINIRNKQYGSKGQYQGYSGDYHLHISFSNSMHRTRWTGTSDFLGGGGIAGPSGAYKLQYGVNETHYLPGRAPVYGLPKEPYTIPGWTYDARHVPAEKWALLPAASLVWGAGKQWETDRGRVNYLIDLFFVPDYDERPGVKWGHHFGLTKGGGYFGEELNKCIREWALKHGLKNDDSYEHGKITPRLIANLGGQVPA